MSSAATAGPPPGQNDPVNGGGPTATYPSSNGIKVAAQNGMKSMGRIFPHIDDLVATRPDINALAPIRKLLLEGELYAKQAETHLDFRRPDIALQEYIKASIIAVDLIPRHKDYPELKTDRGELHRIYSGLQKRISTQHEKFEGIKEIIKENNVLNGVKPKLQNESFVKSTHSIPLAEEPRAQPSTQPEITQGQSVSSLHNGIHGEELSFAGNNRQNLLPHRNENAPPIRQKPIVQPKPESLHSRAVKPNVRTKPIVSPVEDLAARFARLRESASSPPVQDPRIRTRPIAMPETGDLNTKPVHSPSPSRNKVIQIRPERPLGPRDMPKAPLGPPRPQKIPLDVEIPNMPKVPDAIYSPSWNLDIPANVDILRSSSRNMHTVAGKSAAVAPTNGIVRASSNISERNEHSLQTPSHLGGPTSKKSHDFHLPESAVVTAEELLGYLQRGSHELYILLVDIRDREDFDSGHIMSHSIICVEPIVLRKGISAEELGQSLVLSPESEQSLFETRDSFDLVVYYDQSSSSDTPNISSSKGEESTIADFEKAVYEYGYEKRLRRRPRLLVGGLDAWTDLMGIGALETSQTLSQTPGRRGKNAGQLSGRGPMARETRRLLARRRMDYESRPLSKEAELKWEKALRDEEAATLSDDVSFIRTTDDFFRRYPDPSAIQESMVSPPTYSGFEPSSIKAKNTPGYNSSVSHDDELPDMPRIPTRPAPALPRSSYSGISERTTVTTTTSGSGSPLAFKETDTISHTVSRRRHTGLTNFRSVTCYMNAVTQSLNWTDLFSDYLIRFPTSPIMRVPRKKGEESDPPQLMTQNLGQVFRQLSSGRWENYTPDLFRAYVNDIHRKSATQLQAFGGPRQQDAEEFLSFLLEVLEDELNVARDKGPLIPLTSLQEEVRRQQPLIRSSWMEWQRYQYSHRSFITQSFCGQSVTDQTCNHCGFVQRAWDTWMTCPVDIDHLKNSKDKGLDRALQYRFGRSEPLEDYKCDKCKETGASRTETVSRCPEILIIMLRRTMYINNRSQKSHVPVSFPLDNLTMDSYFISAEGKGAEQLDRSFIKPFRYDCYAVVQHEGSTIDAGHYWTFVRDLQPSTRENWYKFEDTRPIVQVKDIRKATQNALSYLLFYKRQAS